MLLAKVNYVGHSEYCHDETCCCNTYSVSIDGAVVSRTAYKSEAEKSCSLINSAIEKAAKNSK